MFSHFVRFQLASSAAGFSHQTALKTKLTDKKTRKRLLFTKNLAHVHRHDVRRPPKIVYNTNDLVAQKHSDHPRKKG